MGLFRPRKTDAGEAGGAKRGHLPGAHDIEGYGAGGFRFGGMSHRGSILALPSGIYAWDLDESAVGDPEALTLADFARVFEEPAGAVDHLLIGTGARMLPLFDLCAALRAKGFKAEPMATDAAARTYSILSGERRKVAAALIAVG